MSKKWKDNLISVKKTRLNSPRTVAICGFADSSRHLAPYDRRNVEIWGCNEAYNFDFMKTSEGEFRADRWFQIHDPEDHTRQNNPNDPRHYEWLQAEHNFPIYMQEKYKGLPNAKKYPIEKYDKLFFENMFTVDPKTEERLPWLEVYKHGYFTSTFSYMVAMAIAEGFKRIEIWGFHMGSQSEYLYQKGACEFWIGQGLARGVDIVVAGNSPILSGELYGYEFSQIIQMQEINERIVGLESDIEPIQQLSIQLQGARKENLYQQLKVKELDSPDQLVQLKERHLALTDKELEEGAKINFLRGAVNENYAMSEQITERHPDDKEAANEGWIARLSLEVRFNYLDLQVDEARSSLDAVTGARMEVDRILKEEDLTSEVFESRRAGLFQAEVDWDNKLNFILGGKTEIKRYMLKTDNRSPNFTDEKGFGDMLLLDLNNPVVDVLELGKDGGAS